MAKKIAWTAQAKADMRAIDQQTALRILHGLARFIATEEGDLKRLQDIDPPEFRLRAGDYRGALLRSRRHHRDSRDQAPPRSVSLKAVRNGSLSTPFRKYNHVTITYSAPVKTAC
jgi:hypothetical protein